MRISTLWKPRWSLIIYGSFRRTIQLLILKVVVDSTAALCNAWYKRKKSSLTQIFKFPFQLRQCDWCYSLLFSPWLNIPISICTSKSQTTLQQLPPCQNLHFNQLHKYLVPQNKTVLMLKTLLSRTEQGIFPMV